MARDTGTFSSPFGLVSFIAPLGAFALATAYLDRRLRGLAIGVFALVSVGIIGSYVRFGFIAVVLGAAFFVFVLLAGRGTNRRTKLLSVGLIAAILLAGFAATLAAGTVSNTAKERAEALTNPFSDPSAKVRFRRWDYASEYIVKHPLGAGLGAVDPDARRVPGEAPTFTDNSYLTVLVEQGVVGLLFIVGILGACFFTARRLARAGPTQHPLAVAALTGFVAFLALCFSAEYLEQPGKALAWTMLGIAVAGALAPGLVPLPPRPGRGHDGRPARSSLGPGPECIDLAPVGPWPCLRPGCRGLHRDRTGDPHAGEAGRVQRVGGDPAGSTQCRRPSGGGSRAPGHHLLERSPGAPARRRSGAL